MLRVATDTAAVAEGRGGVVDGVDGNGDSGGVGCGESVATMLTATGKAMAMAAQNERLVMASYALGDLVLGELPLILAFLEQVARTVNVLQQLASRPSHSGEVRRGALCSAVPLASQ